MDVKFVIIVVLLITATFIFLGFVYPKFTEIQSIKDDIDVENSARDDAENKAKILRDEIDQYANLKDSDLDLLDRVLPKTADLPNLYVHVNSLVLSSGLITRDIVIEGEGGVESAASNNTGEGSGFDSASSFRKIPLTVLAEGSYDSLKEFLKRLEESLRVIDVQSIEISPQSGGTGMVRGFGFKVSADVYYKD